MENGTQGKILLLAQERTLPSAHSSSTLLVPLGPTRATHRTRWVPRARFQVLSCATKRKGRNVYTFRPSFCAREFEDLVTSY